MLDQLKLYNKALRILGETKVLAEENREPKRVLDDIWDSGFVDSCLEAGQWGFATRTVSIDYTPSVEPEFGYKRAFQMPDDLIRLSAISIDEYFRQPFTGYSLEAGFIFADVDTLFLKYISNSTLYGLNMAKWSPSFINYAALAMAYEAAPRITNNKVNTESILLRMQKALTDALAKDAMARPTVFLPSGSWAGARRGNMNVNKLP